MSTPLISVIVPVYNVEPYLCECLDSIINQTYKNLEIILVDDGSTDNSGATCDEYASRDVRIRVIHKENGGLSSARNAGLDNAQGDYISFVDSDDWLDLETYATTMREFEQDETLDIVRFNFVRSYKDGSTFIHRVGPLPIMQGKQLLAYATQHYLSNFNAVWTAVYRKTIIGDLRFIEGLLHEDQYFSLMLYTNLTANAKCLYIDKPLYMYRQRESDSITSMKSIRHVKDCITGYSLLMSTIEKENPEALGYANAYILYFLERQSESCIKINEQEVYKDLKYFLQKLRIYPIKGNFETQILTRLFILSPSMAYQFGRIYQPIARRLGFSKRYR